MKSPFHSRPRPRISPLVAESLEARRLLSFTIDSSATQVYADADSGGSPEYVATNPAHATDSENFVGNENSLPFLESTAANASYQTTGQQITLHADATSTFTGSSGIADLAESGVNTLSFSLAAAATVQLNATLSGTAGGGATFVIDQDTGTEIDGDSNNANSFHQAENFAAGTHTIDVAARSDFPTVGGTTSTGQVDVTLTLGAGTAPQINSANAITFPLGKFSAFTVTTSGSPAPTLTETAILPDGITFTDNGDGTGTLAGTPDASDLTGHSDLIFTARNGVSPDATQFFTLTLTGGPGPIDQPPKFTSTVKSFTYHTGQAAAYTITSTGTPIPSLSVKGTLPAGLSFQDNHDGTASLFGQPSANAGGKYKLVIVATDGLGHTVQQSITIDVVAPAQTPQDFAPKPVIPARPVVSGSRKNKATIIFHNSRLESFSGAFGFSLYASPTQSYSADTAVPLAQTSVKLKVAAAKDKSVPVNFSAPIAIAAGNYYLVAVFDDNTVGFSDNTFEVGNG